jgi:DNA polymerase
MLGWWQLAGVDVTVTDAPRHWLRPAPAAALDRAASAHVAAPAAEPLPIPDTLKSLVRWLASPDNLVELSGARLAPTGNIASGLMLLTDMPDPDDAAEDRLIAGSAGRLLDAMLAAVGRDRESIYLASLAPARPAAGTLDQPLQLELARMARQHVALASPRMLLLLGDATTRALTGLSFAEARGSIHAINLDCGIVRAIATFHPRFLLKQPACKADAWADLRLMLETLNS